MLDILAFYFTFRASVFFAASACGPQFAVWHNRRLTRPFASLWSFLRRPVSGTGR